MVCCGSHLALKPFARFWLNFHVASLLLLKYRHVLIKVHSVVAIWVPVVRARGSKASVAGFCQVSYS